MFFNSFESPTDTLHWYWAEPSTFTGDVPPGGGSHALEVRGQRILPAASFVTRPLATGGYFVVECWGKAVDIGGYIELASVADHEIASTVQAHITEPRWEMVRSADTLFCPPNSSIMLTMQAGALMPGVMRIDQLRIRKLDKPLPGGDTPLARRGQR